MKKIQINFALIIWVVFFSCSTPELTTIPPKMTEGNDFPVEYFQNYTDGNAKNQHLVQIFPEKKQINPEINKPDIPSAKNTVTDEKIIESASGDEMYKKQDTSSLQSLHTDYQDEKIFRIVSGSFLFKSNAEQFVKILKNIGYKSTFIEQSDKGFNRVIVEKNFNEFEARQYLQNYKEIHPEYKGVWLLYDKEESLLNLANF